MPSKHILTIATGKKLYIDMACNLAYSFLHWHPHSDVEFQIVTDHSELIPDVLSSKISVIKIHQGELGEGFSAKLHLDKIASPGQTIFIDSDCLIFENIEYLFGKFKGKAVSVVGGYISNGQWFGDIQSICEKFGLSEIPKFNGGLYYVEKGPIAANVYKKARELEQHYDEIGFKRLRGRPNDEVLLALAMQLNEQTPITDDGTIMSDPQACQGPYKIDVIKGTRRLINPPAGTKGHQDWYPFHVVSPAIVHFLGYYTNHYPYRREVYRLKKLAQGRLNSLTELKAYLSIELPEKLLVGFKDIFRRPYHMLFGYRKIKKSERVV